MQNRTSNIYEPKYLSVIDDINIFQWSQTLKPKETNINLLMSLEVFQSAEFNEFDIGRQDGELAEDTRGWG